MGQITDGVWTSGDGLPDKGGAFDRPQSHFRHWIAAAGPHPPEPGRYHLYVSLACPWAHRALILRMLKRLESEISLSVTHWLMGEQGWTFEPGPGVIPDPYGAHALHEVYRRADPHFTGRVTVPVLWDKQAGTIVSNESADIIFLNGPVDRRTTSSDRVQAPASKTVLQAGAVIPAALLTGLRSDLPGQITAQVTEAVYDSPTGKILLIPQGARLIGQYDAQVAFGQSRALLVWNRLVMPNGRSIVLERQPGADPEGYAGLEDQVDN